MINYREFGMRITHIPTGIKATVNGEFTRTFVRQIANRKLRSMIYSRSKGIIPNDRLVATYELPDEVVCPNDMIDYRKPLIQNDRLK